MTEIIKTGGLEIAQAVRSNDPFALEIYSDSLTIELAYAKPIIKQILKGNKKSEIMGIIYETVKKKLEGMGKRAQLSEAELRTFVLDWIRLRAGETIEDIILMLDMGRRGEFGKIYGDIDVMLLHEWSVKYFDRKYEIIERIKKNQTDALWKAPAGISPEQAQEYLKQIEEDKQ